MRIRAEDLLKEDAIKPNILDAVRDLERKVARMQRAKKIEANVGDKLAAHNVLSPERNLVTVAQEGGDFEDPIEALIAIEDASVINPYTILVYPGIYNPPQPIVLKPYVALVGTDRDVCIIQSADYDNLLTMASNSSLNEIQVINLGSFAPTAAIYAPAINNFLIDSVLARVSNNVANVSMAMCIDGATTFRVLGSEFYAKNINAGGVNRAAAIWTTLGSPDAEFRYCYFELEPSSLAQGAGLHINAVNDTSLLRIHNSRILVDNIDAYQSGLLLSTPGYNNRADIVATSIEHRGTAGGGYDLDITGTNAIAYVRGVRYSTWATATGGQIIPLAGDRPRLERLHDTTAFTLTAAGNAWENDPTGSLTIDLPCESDLKVDVAILWRADTIRASSFRARLDLDGVAQSGSLGYAGESVVNNRMVYSLSVGFGNVATGNHTLTIQVARNNAADTVTVDARQITVMSDPWP